jgi:hypothetical protein
MGAFYIRNFRSRRPRGPSDAPQAFAGVAREGRRKLANSKLKLLRQGKLLFASPPERLFPAKT